MPLKRNVYILKITVLLMIILAARLLYLQVFSSGNMARAASYQRISSTQLGRVRGNILDRNGITFTNRNSRMYAVLKPFILKNDNDQLKQVCSLFGTNMSKIKEEMEQANDPILFAIDNNEADELESRDFTGVSIINFLKRYDDASSARHILGYLNGIDQTGMAGLEKFFNRILDTGRSMSVAVITDAVGKEVPGLGYRLLGSDNGINKLNIKLTLDYHIQKIVEDVMKESNITGAVVVEDIINGDIVAISSMPDFDQNQINKYLKSPENELFNRAVASYNAGSVFKIVDAALALEGDPYYDDKYFCTGSIKIGNIEFACSSGPEGHGLVDFKKAFAVSCNAYFINLAVNQKAKNIINMAAEFGLGSLTGINKQGIDESAGNLPPANKSYTDGDTANISIGQGDVLVTPLQIADMVATIANGGEKNRVNIVDSVVDDKGNTVRNYRVDESSRIISATTAEKLKRMMEAVTASKGTGSKANIDKYGGSAGKTGSAEGPYVDGEKTVHAWFAGYFPKSDPKYSIAVFVENGRYGGQAAAPVFADIAEQIMIKGL